MIKTLVVLLVATAGMAMASITVPEPAATAEIGTAAIGVALLVWRTSRRKR